MSKNGCGKKSTSGHAALTGTGSDDGITLDPVENKGQATFTKVTEDYTALLGQRVKVLYKDTDEVYGVSAVKDNKIVMNVKASALDKSEGDLNKIKIDGTKYTVDKDAKLYIANGITNSFTTTNADTDTDGTLEAGEVSGWITATGVNDNDFDATVISHNDDNNIDTIIIYKKTFAKITSMNSDTIYWKEYANGVDAGNAAVDISIEDDEPETYEGMAKNDYVFVSRNYFEDVPVIEKAEKITGKTDATRSDELRIDGNWYNFSKNGNSYNGKVNNEVDLYVYGTYAYLVEGTGAADIDVLLVKSIGDYKTLKKGGEVEVVMDDGTETTINVVATVITNAVGTDPTPINAANWKSGTYPIDEDKLYEYDEDDGDYTLKEIVSTSDKGYYKIDKTTGEFTGFVNDDWKKDKETINGHSVDDDAVIFMRYTSAGDEKYRVIKPSSLRTYKDLSGTVDGLLNSDSNVVAAFLDYGTKYAASGDDLYGVVTKTSKQNNNDGKSVIFFDFIAEDGEHTEVESNMTDDIYNKGDIVKFNGSYEMMEDVEVLGDDGYAVNPAAGNEEWSGYASVEKVNESSGLITFRSALFSSSSRNSGVSAKKDDNTVVIGVDMKNGTYKHVGDINPGETGKIDSTDNYYANVYAISDDDGMLDLLVVEANDRIKRHIGAQDDQYVVMYDVVPVATPTGTTSGNWTWSTGDAGYDLAVAITSANFTGSISMQGLSATTGTRTFAMEQVSGANNTDVKINQTTGVFTITQKTAGDVFKVTVTDTLANGCYKKTLVKLTISS